MVQGFSYTCIISHIINIIHQHGNLFSKDEPTLTRHYQSESIVYTRVHCWCYTFCEFGQMYKNMYLSLLYHSEHLTALAFSLLCLTPVSPWKPLVFALSPYFCLFQSVLQLESYSIQPFQDCLLSLINVHLRLLHAFSWLDSSFLLAQNNNLLSQCTTVYPFTY